MAIIWDDAKVAPQTSARNITWDDEPAGQEVNLDKPFNLSDAALPIAGAVGAGLLGKWILQPEARFERGGLLRKLGAPFGNGNKNSVRGQLKGMQESLGIPGTNPSDTPRILGDLQQKARGELKSFERDVFHPKTSELSSHIKTNYPEYRKSISTNYVKGLDVLDSMFDKNGVQLSNAEIESNVIDIALAKARKGGISEESLKPLVEAKTSLQKNSIILDAKLNPIETKIPFSQAKSVISNAMKDDPVGPASAILRREFAGYLEKVAPKEALPYLKSHEESFQRADALRRTMTKVSDPNTDELDVRGLNKYLQDPNSGSKALLKALSGEEPNMATPMAGVKEKTADFQNQLARRDALTKKPLELLDKKIEASKLNSRLSVLDKKISILGRFGMFGRQAANAVAGKIGGVGQGVGVIKAFKNANDRPDASTMERLRDMLYTTATGENLYKQQKRKKELLDKKDLNTEEFIELMALGGAT